MNRLNLYNPWLLFSVPSVAKQYDALGRRLGYPLKLVTTNGHIFARWQSPDGKERFNIEGTNQGLSCFEDAYYQRWPHKITEQDIRACRYLKSLTAQEELALFLATRGHCLEAVGQLPQAQLAYAHAHRLAPDSVQYLGFLAHAVQTELSQARKALNIKQGD